MLRDRRDLAVSTPDRGALDACERGIEQLNGYSGNPLGSVEEALAADPGCVLAQCLKAALAVMSSERSLEPTLRQAVLDGERAAGAATPRERLHLAAARAWLERDFERALALYDRAAVEHPRDLLALQVAQTGHFLLGHQAQLRDQLAQALHAWDDEVPGHGWVLGMYAFGLEETGDYAQAEQVGRRAAELNPADAWAAHAVAHVMEMNARLEEGIAWLTAARRGWAPDNTLAYHNHWHLALLHLDRGEPLEALEIYDRRIRPQRSDVAMEMVDASALLWRLFLRGHGTGARLEALADDWRARLEDRYYAFNDLHALMAFAAAGREREVEAVLRAVEESAAGPGSNARVAREAGLPVARALAAFARGHYRACAEELYPVRHAALCLGGSTAQRDVLFLTLAEAAVRAGDAPLARALASERIRLRPASPSAWTLTARALELAGDGAQAARAGQQAERLRVAAGARPPEGRQGMAAGAGAASPPASAP